MLKWAMSSEKVRSNMQNVQIQIILHMHKVHALASYIL